VKEVIHEENIPKKVLHVDFIVSNCILLWDGWRISGRTVSPDSPVKLPQRSKRVHTVKI
jgi:hypothetical protein